MTNKSTRFELKEKLTYNMKNNNIHFKYGR